MVDQFWYLTWSNNCQSFTRNNGTFHSFSLRQYNQRHSSSLFCQFRLWKIAKSKFSYSKSAKNQSFWHLSGRKSCNFAHLSLFVKFNFVLNFFGFVSMKCQDSYKKTSRTSFSIQVCHQSWKSRLFFSNCLKSPFSQYFTDFYVTFHVKSLSQLLDDFIFVL